MAVRAYLPHRILRSVIGDLATPYRPETMVREPGADFEYVGILRRHPVEDRDFFFHQHRPVDPARSIRGHTRNPPPAWKTLAILP